MRRTLPSTRDLCCFEAVVRNGSVTRAANELNMTQSAVSRRISYLEKMLGERLFLRDRQRIVPTSAAFIYAAALGELLNGIEVATTKILTHGRMGGALTLACLPTFGSRWLVPRLNGFIESYPGIDINLISKIRRFDFNGEEAHAAIYFGPTGWPGSEMHFLMPESVVPVAAPSIVDGMPLLGAEALRGMTLIQHTTRPALWRQWLNMAGVEGINGDVGPKFEYYSLVIEAATAGIGVALLPEFLVRREIEQGLLAKAVNLPMKCEEAYYFVVPEKHRDNPNVVCFGKWLGQEIARFLG
jgi:DNA-binding transcriptional LysR family regulator